MISDKITCHLCFLRFVCLRLIHVQYVAALANKTFLTWIQVQNTKRPSLHACGSALCLLDEIRILFSELRGKVSHSFQGPRGSNDTTHITQVSGWRGGRLTFSAFILKDWYCSPVITVYDQKGADLLVTSTKLCHTPTAVTAPPFTPTSLHLPTQQPPAPVWETMGRALWGEGGHRDSCHKHPHVILLGPENNPQ